MLTECQDCNRMEYIVWCLGLDTSVSMIVKWALSSLPQPDIVIWLKDCWKWHMQQTHNVDIKPWWYLGDTCIQNFYLGKYIIGYMVRNYILSLCWHVTLKWNFQPYNRSGAVKLNFRPYNRRYTFPNENFEYGYPHSDVGERGGSVVECRTPEREVRGSRPTSAVLCPWARHFTPRKYWLITQEAMAPSRHDWKIVDRDVKPQHNQPFWCTF